MDTQTIAEKLTDGIIANSGLEQNRDYIGFSKIGDCPRLIYREYMGKQKMEVTEAAHRFCYAGYHQEADVAGLLIGAGLLDPNSRNKEIVSDISPIFKGHIDGLTPEGILIEIKSVSSDKFESVRAKGKSLFRHFTQVQLYLRYGKMPHALIIYRNRDTYEHLVLHVPYVKGVADDMEDKARLILDAIEKKQAPVCMCGNCIRNEYAGESA